MDSNSNFCVGGIVQLLLIRLGEIPHGLVGIVVWSPSNNSRNFIVGISRLDVIPRIGGKFTMLRHVRSENSGIIHQDLIGAEGELVHLQTRELKLGYQRSDKVIGLHLHKWSAEQLRVVVLSRLDVARNGERHVRNILRHHVAPMSGRVPPLLKRPLGAHVEPAQNVLPHGKGLVPLPLGSVLGGRAIGANVRHSALPLGRVAVDEHVV
mmetsp:Transcript_11870/g.33915  ORF Transcript_11870/g.33915 Transcript_11870/m.33915 type:complete len:209 (-) Transcript_11870:1710-2336(-)